MFRLCYRTEQGNDEAGEKFGYKLHLVYGCTCSPSERAYETVNDNPDAITFSWSFDTTPMEVTGHKPTSLITIDSTKFKTTEEQAILTAIEELLYGKAGASGAAAIPAELPDPDDVIHLLGEE
jgi:hypothetical protein